MVSTKMDAFLLSMYKCRVLMWHFSILKLSS